MKIFNQDKVTAYENIIYKTGCLICPISYLNKFCLDFLQLLKTITKDIKVLQNINTNSSLMEA